ncbi:hypothetical protein BST81_02245 [Leptolyngbya sp. 'hensonii']|uniref:hypothetical protein n=1 Tax=Leptolyngbya sp. 'hensonii' TaxID=1922337 RepID=UPI00094F8C29|nr:hypothetical protein [Leptolyngbya sp. 'hensonii']OLP20079.1 hypothetical protein BST81_02245 [Leptolyngbya sp. 'hensonii']
MHPDFQQRWAPQLRQVDPKDQDLYLLMLVARWLADTRQNSEFDHPSWHYINFPYRSDDRSTVPPCVDPNKENILAGYRLADLLQQQY